MELTDRRTYGWPWRPWFGASAAALTVVVISGIIASSGKVPGWEQGVFHGINGLPDLLHGPMWLFQLAGLLAVPLLVAAAALACRAYRLGVALVVFVPVKLLVEKQVVKELVERQRPGTSICHGDVTCGHFRDVPMEGLSFVSGHAIIAWGIATLVWPYLLGPWRWVPIAIAVLNSIARVYLGAHNPLDVVGGGAIGVAVGALLTLAVGAPTR